MSIMATEAPTRLPCCWTGLLAPLDTRSGDRRVIAATDQLRTRDLPLPLSWQPASADGHSGKVIVGRIDDAWIEDGGLYGRGTFDLDGDHGREAARLVATGMLRGVSVDLDDTVMEMAGDDDDAMMVATSWRLMGACYDEQTEILTENHGWVRFADLPRAERVATRDPKTGRFEWAEPSAYTIYDWSGPMIRFTTNVHRGLDLFVTPNHRMLVQSNRTGVTKFIRADELAVASDRSYRIPLTSTWDVPDLAQFRIPGIGDQPEGHCACGCGTAVEPRTRTLPPCSTPGCDGAAYFRAERLCNVCYQRKRRHGDPSAGGPRRNRGVNKRAEAAPRCLPGHKVGHMGADLILDGDDFAAFMGAWLAEGSLYRPSGRVVLSQRPTSRGHQMYAELWERMFGHSRQSSGSFITNNHRLCSYLEQFGRAREKFIPTEIKDLSARQLRIFFDHYMAGDGAADGHCAYTSSARLAGDLQEIAQKLGMWAWVSERRKDAQQFDGRLIQANGPSYLVNFRNRHDAGRPSEAVWHWNAETTDHYEGTVYCVSVPNEALYVRRNGQPVWCGNTLVIDPAFNEARISPLDDDTDDGAEAEQADIADLIAEAGNAEELQRDDCRPWETDEQCRARQRGRRSGYGNWAYAAANLPIADRDRPWDGSAAQSRIIELCGEDKSCWSRAYLVTEGAETVSQAKFPVADVIGGRLMLVPKAVVAAAGRANQATGVDQAALRRAICRLYGRLRSRFDDWPECPLDTGGQNSMEQTLTAAAHVYTADWFTDPKLPGPTPLSVTDDGQVFGHLATWNVCHTGLPGCTTAPRSVTGYAMFHTGEISTSDGPLPVGKLTLGTGHADPRANPTAAAAHYDHTGAAVAVVRAGEDAHGIWVAGAIIPGTDDARIAELRRSPLSGDWRRIEGNLELVAALAVNVPGFVVPRTVAASAAGWDGPVQALVAAGILARSPADPPDDLPAATADARARDLARHLAPHLFREMKAIEARTRAAHALATRLDINGGQ